MTLLVDFIFFSGNVELTEEIESNNRINVYDNCKKHQCQNQLFAIMCDSLQNDFQGCNTDSDVEQMGGEEEVIVVSKNGEQKVSQLVQKWL